MITSWLASLLLLVGAIFVLLASLGVARMPDLYTRMQAATKGGAIGLTFVMGALAVVLSRTEATVLIVMLIAFIVLTAPVAAHAIGRAGYLNGVPLWSGTGRDDLRRDRDRWAQAPEGPPPTSVPTNRDGTPTEATNSDATNSGATNSGDGR